MKRLREYRLSLIWLAVAFFGGCLNLSVFADQANAGAKALTQLEYKREVLGYCGLSDPLSVKGFLVEKQRLIQQYDLNDQMQFDAISDARQAAYAEWQNRGLGGFRGWCREEGKDYTSALKNYFKTN